VDLGLLLLHLELRARMVKEEEKERVDNNLGDERLD
jgi:hypothetical protein